MKAVSGYSKTRTISPIHKGYNELYLLYLDKGFKPIGFWTLKEPIEGQGLKMPIPGKPRTGSMVFAGRVEKLQELLMAIDEAKSTK